MTVRRENEELRILSAIGIILVAAGHLGYNLFDLGGLFPYYSFHVFLFLFVSGYFYRPEAEKEIGRYLARNGALLFVESGLRDPCGAPAQSGLFHRAGAFPIHAVSCAL